MSEPAHYLVFHPERARVRVLVRGAALVRGRLDESWEGGVWADAPPGNEDPFVFGESWAYSYCHATQLRRTARRDSYLQAGSCLIFCSGDFAAEDDVLAVDTVFFVGQAHQWQSECRPPVRYASEVHAKTDLWRCHLRFGGQPGGHKGRYTYEAALHQTSSNTFSRLPLDRRGGRVQLPIGTLGRQVGERARDHLYRRRPVLLATEELTAILDLVDAETITAVVRDIAPADSTFLSARASTQQCSSCGSRTNASAPGGGRGCW